LTSALDRDEWSVSLPGRFTPRERASGTHEIGGWVGPRAGVDAVVKKKIPSIFRDSNPRSFTPYSSTIPLSYPGSSFVSYDSKYRAQYFYISIFMMSFMFNVIQ
jgi:hypothetical protein